MSIISPAALRSWVLDRFAREGWPTSGRRMESSKSQGQWQIPARFKKKKKKTDVSEVDLPRPKIGALVIGEN
ncbi:hypothetical protein ACKS0A_04211 [Histoplasma ohiense]